MKPQLALMLVFAFAMAGCADTDQRLDAPEESMQEAPQGTLVFENETLEGRVSVTWGIAAYIWVDGLQRFDIPSGTRNVTMDLSWTPTTLWPYEEVKMSVWHETCSPSYANCPAYYATTQGGKATLTIEDPQSGTHLVWFWSAGIDEAASGTYVIEVQHEIWEE